MITITKKFEFAAAHFLPYHKGKCKNVHGHNFCLEVTIAGPIQKEGSEKGMVMDFSRLKEVVSRVLLNFDHCNLNDTFFNPTAENMVNSLVKPIQNIFNTRGLGISVVKIRLWETPTSCVTWRRGCTAKVIE